jgi:hypothetical protein
MAVKSPWDDLAALKRERREMVKRQARERRNLDRRILRLKAICNGKKPKRQPGAPLDPHMQAGPKNIALMGGIFKKLGRASAHEATTVAGYRHGQQAWAIRALVEDGRLRDTGERVGRSRVYEYVPSSPVSYRDRDVSLKPGE